MTPEEQIAQLKNEFNILREEFDRLKSAANIPYDIYQALKTRLIPVTTVKVNKDNVSATITDAELDTAFGDAASLPDGFIGLVDDNAAETTVWLCLKVGTSWWYEQLTKAT